MSSSTHVRTRIAPSPTGYFHVGTARTALFNYLYAKKHGGEFILRIEDTDPKRSKSEFEVDILEQLEWLGLLPDDTCKQSELTPSHTKALKALVESDHAYISEEPSKDDPKQIVQVVRLRNSGETVSFNDLIRGEISFDTTELGDFVIARSLTEPLYHLAVVVDDAAMRVSHVIRGEDHISNTPRQILIARALGYTIPQYAHLPLLLAPDRSKLSKRKHAVSVKDFREKGFEKDAFINFLALLGWNPGDDREVMSLEEITAAFDLQKIQKGGAIFDMEKLRWMNREYLLKMSENEFNKKAQDALREVVSSKIYNEAIATSIIPLMRERVHVWSDVQNMAKAGEFDYFFSSPDVSADNVPWKAERKETTQAHLQNIYTMLSNISNNEFSSPETIKNAIWEYAEREGRGSVLWPFRYALCGRDKSPDPFTIASIVGKDATLQRVQHAIDIL